MIALICVVVVAVALLLLAIFIWVWLVSIACDLLEGILLTLVLAGLLVGSYHLLLEAKEIYVSVSNNH